MTAPSLRGRALGVAALTVLPRVASAQAMQFHYPPPGPGAIVVTRDVQYGTADTTKLMMDVYRPAAPPAAATPLLIFFNVASGPQRAFAFYTRWAETAALRGLVAIVPDLRGPQAPQDFQRLLTHIGERGSSYGIDRDAIAVYAGSGNVATALPLVQDPGQTAVKAAVMYYGIAGVTTFRLDLPMLYVRAGLDRPSLNGGTASGITALVANAIAHNAPITVLNHSFGYHGFEVANDDAATRDVIDQTIDFVKRATSRGYQSALRQGLTEATAASHVITENFGAAASTYARVVAERPEDARLRLAYGEALLGDRQFTAACTEFEKLKGKGLGPRDLGLPAARACLQKGDADAAIAWLQSIPKRFLPPNVQSEPVFAPLQQRADFQALFR